MKIKILKLLILLLVVSTASLEQTFAQQKKPNIQQQKKVNIQITATQNQLMYASNEIRKAATEKKYIVTGSSFLNSKANDEMVIRIISDSATSVKTANDENLKMPENLGWQCYAIRVKNNGDKKNIYVLAGDKTGAMYGSLDIAEAFRLQTINSIANSDNKPYLDRRGIKFNIPLDLRTPSYTDPSDAAQQNIPNVWEKEFWETYLDEMAKNRYNVLSLWSLHPFPSMVKIPEFPEVALNDVWRTKEKFDDSYSHQGVNFVRPHLLQNVEVVKKITIDEKIAFWKEVMQMANDRGVEVYVFTWNIFTNGAEGKHGITNRQDNDTTISYFRAAVREMVHTYPLLAGIGITAGEAMNRKSTGEYANEKWLWRTYGEGIRDALKQEPKRNFRLIHRFHQTSLSEIKDAFREYAGPFDLSLKYAIAHMYSITNPPFVDAAMPLLSQQTKSWLTVRNDDIYSFRWANNNFARQFIKDIPEPEKIAGYYMGPDGYNWGRDYLTRGPEHQLVMQKQWYSFMLWGRLSYNPNIPDDIFIKTLQTRLPAIDVKKLYKPWSSASMIFPWITRYVWGDIDLKWFPEANISHPTHKGFFTVADYIEREPMPGSNIRNIYLWAKYHHEGKTDSLQSPMAVADTLTRLSAEALSGLKALPARKVGSFTELDQTLGDIEAFAHIGNYYAAKMKAACSLALFDQFSNESDRSKAIAFLQEAKKHWAQYAKVYDSQYKPALYNRVGFVNIPELIKKVEADITIARNWKPGTIKYQTKNTTEKPFRD
ncbi:MAG: hypothetical protein JWQ40_341 [Segetibacter sp.]|nr:hypothetical protein [Segetibacter sp.]